MLLRFVFNYKDLFDNVNVGIYLDLFQTQKWLRRVARSKEFQQSSWDVILKDFDPAFIPIGSLVS